MFVKFEFIIPRRKGDGDKEILSVRPSALPNRVPSNCEENNRIHSVTIISGAMALYLTKVK
jgi:hypothetical protein